MKASESVRVPESMGSTPMLTFEEFSALRQRESVSSGLTTKNESQIYQRSLQNSNGDDDTNKMDRQGHKLNFGHLMQV